MKTGVIMMAAMLCSLTTHSLTAQKAEAVDDYGCSTDYRCCCDDDNKVCKLVCTTKIIKKIVYGCDCKHICIPCPSKKGCQQCDSMCMKDGKSCCDPCKCGKAPKAYFSWREYIPCGAKTKKVKVLVKYIVIKKIPSYKWIVVDGRSCGCETGQPAGAGKPEKAPLAPIPLKSAYKRPPANVTLGDELPVTKAEATFLSKMLSGVSQNAKVISYEKAVN